MKSTKIDNDKYYTPIDLAKECINKTFELIGIENIKGRITGLTLKNNIEEVGLW